MHMAGKLKPLDVQREEKPGKYADGDGLYLIVAGPTSKNWSYRYWFKGKERWHGLGSFKDVSLKEARLGRDATRLQVRAEECAQAYIDECWNTWSEKHRNQWPSSLKRYAYPTIGQLTIAEIKPSHIYELLRPIWLEKRETANRVRGRIETIIAKNVDVDDKDFRNPAELTKQLREKLPKRLKRVTRHHPALPYADVQRFITDLRAATGIAAEMLRFLIFTACRTNEVIGARWSEIDRSLSTWRIPGARMKMNQDHVVPLSDPAIDILDRMCEGGQRELIFTNPEGGMFSENAMLAVLTRMGYGHVTVHGFRSTFATWAEECTDHPDGVREAALAHSSVSARPET
jgi:integrase